MTDPEGRSSGMSWPIRHGMIALLVMVATPVLITPAAQAQAQRDAVYEQISSAYKKAEAFKGQDKPARAAGEYEQAMDLARRELGPEHEVTAALMIDLAQVYSAM